MRSNKLITVYIDNSIYVLQKIGGISIVFSEIIQGLKKDRSLNITMLVNGRIKGSPIFNNIFKGVSIVREARIPRTILPFFPILKVLPPNTIFHSSYNRYSIQKSIKRVITIHDLGYEKRIMRNGIKRTIHLFFKKIAIRNADAIICVSTNTLNDLKYHYSGVLDNKVLRVIHNGISKSFLSSELNKNTTLPNYVLYVGGRQPYKNFQQVVEAVAELPDYHLCVAGGGPLSKIHAKMLDRMLPGRYFTELDLSTTELVAIYTNASCLVYPSSYEGFGLPILEAMACSCPVISCNNSSIPEIAGEAALLIELPESMKIKEAILKLNDNAYRSSLIQKGIAQASKFSWEKAVQLTTLLYKDLIENDNEK